MFLKGNITGAGIGQIWQLQHWFKLPKKNPEMGQPNILGELT